MAKKQAAAQGRSRDAAGELAEYVGTSLAELMNRRDALARKLAAVERAIATAGRQAGAKVAGAVPGVNRARQMPGARRGKAKAAATAAPARTGNRKKNRPPPPEDPMVALTTRATAAEAKGRAAQQVRSSRRAGNR